MIRIKQKGINFYIAIVLTISYLLAGIYILIFPEKDKISFMILSIIYMFMPLIVTFVIDKFILKKKTFKSWALNFRPNWWFLIAWISLFIFSFLVLAVNTLWPNISLTSDMSGFWQRMTEHLTPEQIEIQKLKIENLPIPLLLFTIFQTLLAGLTINAIAAFGEEVGWRGLMVREYKHLKFWDASFRIGIIWGIWHAPLILMGHNYPEHNFLGVGMMCIFCILLSPLFLYIRIKSHSVIAVSIMHGTLNASASIPLMYLTGGNDLTLGITGFSGFFSILLIILIMIIYDLKFARKPITNSTIIEGIRDH